MDSSEYCNQPTYPLESVKEVVRPAIASQQDAAQNREEKGETDSGKSGKQKQIDEFSIPNSYVQISYGDLHFYECCGAGTFGSVYRAIWLSQGKQEVAVKKINHMDSEAHVLSVLSHRNIVQFYGACAEAPNFCIVTEYAPYGSLFDFLSTKESEKLEFSQLLTWSRDIALGMNYLHEEAPVTVIHRDLKSKNVVICKDFILKICDFGASRFFDETVVMTITGTYPWMAPELIQGLPTSELCDVYSFGVVLWEMLTREVPFKGLQGFQVAWVVVENEERPLIPSSCPQRFANLMKSCWSSTVEKRPPFFEIVAELNAMLNDDDLGEVTNQFLGNKDEWLREMENKMDALRCQEKEINQKEKELKNRERKLKEWEAKMKEEMKKQTLVGVARYNKKTEKLNCKISGTGEGAIDSVKDVLSHIMSRGGMNGGTSSFGGSDHNANFSPCNSSFGSSQQPKEAWASVKRNSLSNATIPSIVPGKTEFDLVGGRKLGRRSSLPGSNRMSVNDPGGFSRPQQPKQGPHIESDINFAKSDTNKTLEIFSKPVGFSNSFSNTTGAETGSDQPSEESNHFHQGFDEIPRQKIQKKVSSSSEQYNFEGSKMSRSTSGADANGVHPPEVQTWESAKGEAKVNNSNEKFELDTDLDLKPSFRPPPPSLRKLKNHNSSPCLLPPLSRMGTRNLEKGSALLLPNRSTLPPAVQEIPDTFPSEQDIKAALESLSVTGPVLIDEKFAERLLAALKSLPNSQHQNQSVNRHKHVLSTDKPTISKKLLSLNSDFNSSIHPDVDIHGSPGASVKMTESVDEFSNQQMESNARSIVEESQGILSSPDDSFHGTDSFSMKSGNERRSSIEKSVSKRSSSKSSNSKSFVSSVSSAQNENNAMERSSMALPSPASRRKHLSKAKSKMLASAKLKSEDFKPATYDLGGQAKPKYCDKSSQTLGVKNAFEREGETCPKCVGEAEVKRQHKSTKNVSTQTNPVRSLKPLVNADAMTQAKNLPQSRSNEKDLVANAKGKEQPYRKAKRYSGKTKRCEIARPKESFIITGDVPKVQKYMHPKGTAASAMESEISQNKNGFPPTESRQQRTPQNSVRNCPSTDASNKKEINLERAASSTKRSIPSEQGFYKGGFLRNRRSLLPSYYRRYFSDSGFEVRSRYRSSSDGIEIPTFVNGIVRSKSEENTHSRPTDLLLRRSASSSPSLHVKEGLGDKDHWGLSRLSTPSPLGRGQADLTFEEPTPPLPSDDQNDVSFQRSFNISPANSFIAPPLSVDSGCCEDGRTSGCSSPGSVTRFFNARDQRSYDNHLPSPQDHRSDSEEWNTTHTLENRGGLVCSVFEPTGVGFPSWRDGRAARERSSFDNGFQRLDDRRTSLQNNGAVSAAQAYIRTSKDVKSSPPVLTNAEFGAEQSNINQWNNCFSNRDSTKVPATRMLVTKKTMLTAEAGGMPANSTLPPSANTVRQPQTAAPTDRNTTAKYMHTDTPRSAELIQSVCDGNDFDPFGRSALQSPLPNSFQPKVFESRRHRLSGGAASNQDPRSTDLFPAENCRLSQDINTGALCDKTPMHAESQSASNFPCRYSSEVYLTGLGGQQPADPRRDFFRSGASHAAGTSGKNVPVIRRLDNPQNHSDIFETDDYTYIIRPRGRKVK